MNLCMFYGLLLYVFPLFYNNYVTHFNFFCNMFYIRFELIIKMPYESYTKHEYTSHVRIKYFTLNLHLHFHSHLYATQLHPQLTLKIVITTKLYQNFIKHTRINTTIIITLLNDQSLRIYLMFYFDIQSVM